MNLLVVAPLSIEARALTRGPAHAGTRVLHVGAGPVRAARAAAALPAFDALVVAGFGGALTTDLSPADLLVATEVHDATTPQAAAYQCSGAADLAALLCRADRGPVRTGVLVTSGHVVKERERGVLAARGAVAVDMEAAPLVAEAARRGKPFAVVRVIVDTPDHPLLRPGTLRGGVAAYRRLRALRPALAEWAEQITARPPSPRR